MGPLKKVLFQVHQFYENKFRELRILNKSLNICHLFISFQSLNILPEMYKSGLQTTLLAIVYTRSLWGWPPLPHGYVKAQALKTNHFIFVAHISSLHGTVSYLGARGLGVLVSSSSLFSICVYHYYTIIICAYVSNLSSGLSSTRVGGSPTYRQAILRTSGGCPAIHLNSDTIWR